MDKKAELDDWQSVVETTYGITKIMFGRGKAYDLTIAKTLGIAGEYQVLTHNTHFHRIK